MRALTIFAFVCVFAASAQAQAQDAPPPPAGDAASAGVPAPPAPARPATKPASDSTDEAWQAYHRAVLLVLRGERQQATEAFRDIAGTPGHPARARAQEVLALLDPADESEALDPSIPERATALARAELAIVQTFHGLAIGSELCIILECDGPRIAVGILAVSGGGALAASLLLPTDGITPGHTAAINSGTVWGFWNGLAINGVLNFSGDEKANTARLLGMQLVGTAAGAASYFVFAPRDGDVAMANSGGFWSLMLTVMLHGINEFDADAETIWTTLLLASDLGIVAGAAASQSFKMSRSRTILIDVGGVLGWLGGAGLYTLVVGEDGDATPLFTAGLAGTIGGLGTAIYLTRDWDDAPEKAAVEANFFVLPNADGGAVAGVGGRF